MILLIYMPHYPNTLFWFSIYVYNFFLKYIFLSKLHFFLLEINFLHLFFQYIYIIFQSFFLLEINILDFFFNLFLNKVIISQKFRYFLIFCVILFLFCRLICFLTCYDVVLFVALFV